LVTTDLLAPKMRTGGRPPKVPAMVAVEEATINKDDGMMPGQYQIRPSREVPDVQSETVAERVESLSNHQLRLRIAPTDRCHVFATRFRRMDVSHHTTMPICCPAARDFRARTCGLMAAAIA